MENKKLITGIVLSFFVVIAVSLLARVAFAEGPPQEVADRVKPIHELQETIAETREAYERFVEAKAKQAELEKLNNAQGWRTNWETLQPVPIDPLFLSRP
jgi:uncharacterized protein YpmS